jgi:Flp pilus assembly protein TadD
MRGTCDIIATSEHLTLSSKPERSGAADQTLQRAALALQMQRPDEAERLAAAVFKANRGNVAAAALLGRALMLQNRFDEAITPLQKASRRGDDPASDTLLAAAFAATGRRDDALDLLRRAIARRPAFPPAFLEYAGQLASGGKIDEAIAVLEQGLALAPGIIELQLRLATLYIGSNARTQARALLQQAANAAPSRHDVLAELARVMVLDGDHAAAVDVFRRALAQRPDDAPTRANLGICLMEMGERAAGEASVREAARGRPDMRGRAIMSLAAASRGRFFLRPSAAAKFLTG